MHANRICMAGFFFIIQISYIENIQKVLFIYLFFLQYSGLINNYGFDEETGLMGSRLTVAIFDNHLLSAHNKFSSISKSGISI